MVINDSCGTGAATAGVEGARFGCGEDHGVWQAEGHNLIRFTPQ